MGAALRTETIVDPITVYMQYNAYEVKNTTYLLLDGYS